MVVSDGSFYVFGKWIPLVIGTSLVGLFFLEVLVISVAAFSVFSVLALYSR